MNALRIETINGKAPYRVTQDPERNNNFYLISDSGVRFDIDFTYNDAVIPIGAYEIGIANKENKRSPLDMKLRLSVFAIIEEFFEQNNEVMLYLTETGDEKQVFRNRLFVRWFNTYEHHERYIIRTAEGCLEGQENFIAIISRLDNPRLALAIEEFDETAALLFGQ
jgi:hypothetical protein